MDIKTYLKSAQGGAALQNLSAAFGVDPAKAAAATSSLVDALSQRIERNTLSRGGIADVVELLGDDGAGRALGDPQDLAKPGVAEAGNHVLDVLIGNKHISRGIAAEASKASGLDAEITKKMLPAIASMLIGGLQQETAPQLTKLLRDVPGLALSRNGSPLPLPGEGPMDGDDQQSSKQGDTWGQNLPKPSGTGGGGMGGTIGGGSPLPVPGDNIPGVGRRNNPYENLPDVIRRGGTSVPSGGTLENVIRSILGNLLGFGNRGILGSLFQLFLIKVLPAILRSIFSRATGR